MSDGITIDNLRINVESSASAASGAIQGFVDDLEKLKVAVAHNTAAKKLGSLADSLRGFNDVSNPQNKLAGIATELERMKNVGSVRSVANSLSSMVDTLTKLQAISDEQITMAANAISRIAEAMRGFDGMKISGVSTTIKSLGDISTVTDKLSDETLTKFQEKVQRVSSILAPLNEKATTLSSALKTVDSSSRKASTGLEKVNKAVNAQTLNLASLTVAWSKIRGAIGFIKSFANGAVEDSVEWDGVSERFIRGFENNAQEAYSWIERLNEEMGLNKQQFMQYTSIYAQMLEGLGVVTSDAYKMALGYSELTYDIWAGYNDVFKTYDDAAQAIQSAISGNTRAIRRAGFSVLNTTLAQTAANHGLDISIQGATEAEKSYLRYLALVDQAHSTNIIGTYAQEMSTAEGVIRTLAQEVKSLGQAFGSLFLPLLQKSIPIVTAVVELASDAVHHIAALFGIQIQTIDWDASRYTAGITDYAEGVEDVADAYGSASGAAEKYKRTILGIDEINPLNAKNAGGGGGGGGGGSDIGNGITDWDISSVWTDSIFDRISSNVKDIKAKIEEFLPLIETIGAIVGTVSFGLLVNSIAESLAGANMLIKVLGSIATLALNLGLNITFAENYAESGGIGWLIAEALTTAASGWILFKALGPAGLSASLAVSVIAQITGMYFGIKEGGDFNIGQGILTALEGAGAGAALGWALGLGPTGIIIGAAVGLTLTIAALAIATSKAEFEKAVQEDIDSRFGTVHYTAEQIEMLADHILIGFNDSIATVNGNSITMKEALSLYADADLNINARSVVVDNAGEAFGKLLSSVSIGIDVSDTEMEQYFGDFLSAGQEYLNENQLRAQLAFGVLGLDGSELSDASSDAYSTYGAQYEELGKQLHDILAEAFVDGEWIPEKMEVAQQIFGEMQDVLNQVSNLQLSAGLEGLSMDIGSSFDAESFASGMSAAWEQAQSSIETLMSARNTAIAEAMANGIYEESKDKIETAFRTRKMEIELEVMNFGINTLNLRYEDALQNADFDGLATAISENIQTRLSTGLSDININTLFTGFSGDNPFLIDDKVTRESLERMLQSLLPTEQDMLMLAEEYKALGEEIPSSVRDGINNTEMLKAMIGDAEAVDYMVGAAMAQGEAYTSMISTIENAFANVDEAGRRGIANNTQIVYDSATGMAVGVVNAVTGEIVALTPTVLANMQTLGLLMGQTLTYMGSDLFARSGKVGDDIILGLKSPITSSGDTIPHLFEEIGNDSITALRTTVDAHSPAREFSSIGQDIMSGLTSPLKTGSSVYNTLMQTISTLGSSIISKFKGAFDKDTMSTIGSSAISSITTGMKGLDIPNFHFDWTQAYKQFTILGKTMSMYVPWPKLSFYAQGGFPSTGELFMARESGNEFVGRVGNKSAVANNDQLVEAVARGVADAMGRSNSLLQEQNGLLREMGNSSGGGYVTAGGIVNGLNMKNRRDGRSVVVLGV